MVQQLLLNLGQGSWQTGFANVIAQRWESDQPAVQLMGSLPPAPALATDYQRWQQLYGALYGPRAYWRQSEGSAGDFTPGRSTEPMSTRRMNGLAGEFEFETGTLTNVSHHDFETLCATLKIALNQWLSGLEFASIERRIRTQLSPLETIRVMLTAHDKTVLRFPWRLW
ncbi:MAG: hypothetical protein AAFY72_18090, partial [Cyanobacteria bacterium J06649_4]